MRESYFQGRVVSWINDLENGWATTIQAGSIRGIPDVLASIGGTFVALELKLSGAKARKKTGNIVLQKFVLKQIAQTGGYAKIVTPENWHQIQEDLLNLSYSAIDL